VCPTIHSNKIVNCVAAIKRSINSRNTLRSSFFLSFFPYQRRCMYTGDDSESDKEFIV